MMKLFLDDIRTVEMVYTEDEAANFEVVRSYTAFLEYIKMNRMPDFISFDNDLGLDERVVLAPPKCTRIY